MSATTQSGHGGHGGTGADDDRFPGMTVRMTVNGQPHARHVDPRRTLSDVLRRDCGTTGVHLGCEHGVCGACTVLLDGRTARSCCTLAAQADGAEITTVEGLADGPELHPLQEAFWKHHGLQCGFCTPGFLIVIKELLADNPDPTDEEIREGISGNICRCTGYQFIVDAVRDAARILRGERSNDGAGADVGGDPAGTAAAH